MPFHMAEYMCVACLHQKVDWLYLPLRCLRHCLLLIKLCIHIREFPHACQKSARAALMQCHGIIRKQDKYRLIHNLTFLLLTADGQISPGVLLSCLTDLRYRAYVTPRCAIRHTDSRAKLHQCLRRDSRILPRIRLLQFPCDSLLRCLQINVCIICQQPAIHAQYISIHRRCRCIKADRRDCTCRVIADAG